MKKRTLTAITRAVSPSLADCELTFLARQKIDVAKAIEQHRDYEERLSRLGVRLVRLPAEPDLPDSVFVEDTAIVLDELAIITRPGATSRRAETESVADALSDFRPLKFIQPPATIEGGDVMRVVGDTVFMVDEFPRTRVSLKERGFDVHTIDIGEFQKAEAGLTCLSLIF